MHDQLENIDERIRFVDCDITDEYGKIEVDIGQQKCYFTWDSKPKKGYDALSEAMAFLTEK